MEHIDNSDSLVVEVLPEGVPGEAVADLDFFNSENCHWATFNQQNFFLLWVCAIQGRIHPKAKETVPVLEANDE